MASSSQMGTYIYCIAYAEPLENERTPFHTQPIAGPEHPVRLLRYDDLAAVVSDVPNRRLDIKREYLLTHEAVILEAMEHSAVIPLSFGTIALDDDEVIEQLLKAASEEMHQQLEAIQGCVELDLKVLWKQERLFEEMVTEHERIRALRREIASASVNERIELGQLTSEVIAWKSDQEAQLIVEELEPLTVEVRLNRMLNDMMVMNAALLVEKPRQEALHEKLNALAAAQEERLVFRYNGPVPPYHFVDLSITWEDARHGID